MMLMLKHFYILYPVHMNLFSLCNVLFLFTICMMYVCYPCQCMPDNRQNISLHLIRLPYMNMLATLSDERMSKITMFNVFVIKYHRLLW